MNGPVLGKMCHKIPTYEPKFCSTCDPASPLQESFVNHVRSGPHTGVGSMVASHINHAIAIAIGTDELSWTCASVIALLSAVVLISICDFYIVFLYSLRHICVLICEI